MGYAFLTNDLSRKLFLQPMVFDKIGVNLILSNTKKTRLPASRSSSVVPEGYFLFFWGGGVSFEKMKPWYKNAF